MSKEFDMNESNINQLYQLYKEEFINFCENILIFILFYANRKSE